MGVPLWVTEAAVAAAADRQQAAAADRGQTAAESAIRG